MGTNDSDLADVTIIGGGPVGLFGAFYAGMRQMKTRIIDSLTELGGQLSALYPEKYIFDMPGFPRILAKDLVRDMVEQGTRFSPEVCLGEKVTGLRPEPDGTITVVTSVAERATRTVIVAIGRGAFSPMRLNAEGLEAFEGRGVHYFVRNKSLFAGKNLLIVGGGDSALDWAMNLHDDAASITLIHRRDVFRAHEESVDWLMTRSRVNVKLWHELKAVHGVDRLERATIIHNKRPEELSLDIDHVLINIGFKADLGPVKEWGLEMDRRGVVVNQFMETNLPGVYAAGDIAAFPGKIELIATGVGEICIAVNYAKNRIDPGSKVFPGHSSNMDL